MSKAKKGLPGKILKFFACFLLLLVFGRIFHINREKRMRTLAKNIAFAAVCGLFLCISAQAWDDVGHKITGYIAWQRMSPHARENVIRILRAAPEDSQLATFYKTYGPESDDVKRLEFFIFVPSWPMWSATGRSRPVTVNTITATGITTTLFGNRSTAASKP